MKFFDYFLIFAQNIDCGYTLESWIKIEVLHFRERRCSVAPENVTSITFSGSITFSVVTPPQSMVVSKNKKIMHQENMSV